MPRPVTVRIALLCTSLLAFVTALSFGFVTALRRGTPLLFTGPVG